jgi:protein-S-isoprenylcysteine O-methyltransferase Ste14
VNTDGTTPALDADAAAPRRKQGRSTKWLTPVVALVGLAAPFIGAGTLAWPMAWVYIGLTMVGSIAGRALMLRAHPELAAERSGFVNNAGTKGWDRIIAPLVILGPIVIGLVAGLEFRLDWPPPVSVAVQAFATVVVLAALAFASWAMVSNPFFSSVVRVQIERGHHAVSAGPYRFVRHPAYAATIPAQFGFALMLASAWALIPAALVAALVILRTALEDRTLRAELPGYQDYAARVHYRLLPGIW